ncbi:hypothetical protein JOD82_002569 [Paenibacillus sp. 1182]|uniref:hypothetical protein n=1 Tax=Paenibacillus sp. 1182 TaxID=2806565 RepID=UPI000F92313E|nr:hypothetical protein [Paenibacillus sp. 1182]MBP1309486.1 hypothetical protein [Paenibacillus sp. 1182]
MPDPWKRRFFGILSFVLLCFLLVSLDLIPSLAKAESTNLVTEVEDETTMGASQDLSLMANLLLQLSAPRMQLFKVTA